MLKKWKLLVGLAILFLSGVCVGGAGVGIYGKQLLRKAFMREPNFTRKVIMRKLSHQLDLSNSQHSELEEQVVRMQAELFELKKDIRPRTDDIIKRMIANMNKHLSPPQQEELERFIKELRQRRREMRQDNTKE